MRKRRNSRRLLSSPVILPMLNVVLIAQFFYLLTGSFFQDMKSLDVSTPDDHQHYLCGAMSIEWQISLDDKSQWWLREINGDAHQMSPEAIAEFIDTHNTAWMLFEIDQDTPYFVLESVFAHFNNYNRGLRISFQTKRF